MFARIKKSGQYQYLQIVENSKVGGKVSRRALFTVGRLDHLQAKGSVETLIRSLTSRMVTFQSDFQQYGEGLAVQTVYDCLEVKPATGPLHAAWGTVSVHDPCAMRDSAEVQQAVRRLVTGLSLEQLEMKHRGRRTLCSGEGGMVAALRPAFARAWAKLRGKESGGRRLVSYCAGCCGFPRPGRADRAPGRSALSTRGGPAG